MKLHDTVRALMKDGKGVLCIDESSSVRAQRFSAHGIESSDEQVQAYREIILTTPGIENFISGVFFSEEALKGSVDGAVLFSELLLSKNMLVGVTFDDATLLDQELLHTRILEYKSLGVTFAKMSVDVQVGEEVNETFLSSLRSLSAFAVQMQKENIVPVVGFELRSDSPHSAVQAENALIEKQTLLIDALKKEEVDLTSLVIESVMVGAGMRNPLPAEPAEVAERTVRVLTLALPTEIGGVFFVSSGETQSGATADLNAIARLEPLLWPIAFCFGRALQDPVLEEWRGSKENFAIAQATLYGRISLTARADGAGYALGMESN